MIERIIKKTISERLFKGKTMILTGARRYDLYSSHNILETVSLKTRLSSDSNQFCFFRAVLYGLHPNRSH